MWDVGLACGDPETERQVLLTLATAAFNGDEVLCMPQSHFEEQPLEGWAFGVHKRMYLDSAESSCTRVFLALGAVKGATVGTEEGGDWMPGHGAPFLIVPMELCTAASDKCWTLRRSPDAAPFVNPGLATSHCLRWDGKINFLDLWKLAADVLPQGSQSLQPVAVIAATSSDRSFDRTSQCAVLDILSHHDLWMSSGCRWYNHLFQECSNLETETPQHPLPEIVPQAGFADSSQLYAISKAISGESFILRGPPGCGKTQTLANIAAALVKEGKSVLFVAKMKIALGVFCDKLESYWSGGDDGIAPHILRSQDFCAGRNGDGKIKTENRITTDTRLVQCAAAFEMQKFWSDGDNESMVRQLLRQGWRLASEQPAALVELQEEVTSCVGVKMTKMGERAQFVCSACGKITKSEQPLVKHMKSHVEDKETINQSMRECDPNEGELCKWKEQAAAAYEEQQKVVHPEIIPFKDAL